MKVKPFAVLFIFFAILIAGCKGSLTANNFEERQTVLQKSEEYFSFVDWADSEHILTQPLPEPFVKEGLQTNMLYTYSDTDFEEQIFPSLEGLGLLDYSGIDASLLVFFNSLSLQIKRRQIDENLCVAEKKFLPFMINYKLKLLNTISSVFYSRPEYKSAGKSLSQFRCTISGEKEMYTLLEITAVFNDGKWLIDSFDIIGDVYAETSEQN